MKIFIDSYRNTSVKTVKTIFVKLLNMKSSSFKPRQYNNVIVGGIFLALGMVLLLAKGSSVPISVLFILIGILTIFNTVITRLAFTEDSVALVGLSPKKIKFQDIAKIEWGKVWYKSGAGAGDAGCIIVITQHGKQLRLLPVRFSNYEGESGWAALLLKIINDYKVPADDKVTQQLSNAVARSSPQPRSFV